MANDGWHLISTTTFTGSQSQVVLSAIPQIYDHLVIFASLGDVSASYFYINGTNQIPVYNTRMYSNGGYAQDVIQSFGLPSYSYSYGANGGSNRRSGQWWTFPFYSKSDNYKMVKIHSNSAWSVGNEFGYSGLDTFGTISPITSITLIGTDNYMSGSVVSLYGLVAK